MKIYKVIKEPWVEFLVILVTVSTSIYTCNILLTKKLISGNLFDNLVGGIVSAGLFGFIVSYTVYKIQKDSNSLAEKRLAKSFYETRFIPEIRELFSRNIPQWNLNGGKKFYFDNSYANSIYDLYEKYAEQISSYQKIFPGDEVISIIESIYKIIKVGYVLGEKIDQLLSNVIRLEFTPKGILEHMDIFYLRYLKARLFTKETKKWVEAFTADSINKYHLNMYMKLSNNSNLINTRKDIGDIKNKIESEIINLKSLRVIEIK